ncbi:hypothetical protein DCAR_0312268 [Daucus carota subsp. sativus]|uniref:Uncharacterized protein n=1 Tax=Daucus carota subsp. sativus TaxID=79200 RepID=A0AAF0WNS1_DAUCS|nr:hypothetical protein DCAR_0312268 [Daucus carota subsp. sativus]
MSRRPTNTTRRLTNNGSSLFGAFSNSKSQISPLLSVVLVFLGAIFFIGYFYKGSGDFTCTYDVQRAIPSLKKAYGESMRKVLHVGPDTCSVVSKLLKDEEIEAWGVEPYDIEDADLNCKRLVHRGIVRVANIKFPLPYRAKSFSLVIVSDAVDYLSSNYLNKTLPELARVSSDGLVIFTGFPGDPRAQPTEPAKYGRPAKKRSTSWWVRFFAQTSLEESTQAIKRFVKAAVEDNYKPACQIFQLDSFE